MAFKPFNPDESVRRHRLHLPHWRQWERTYFITSRLADALPSAVRDEWLAHRTAWLAQRGISRDRGPDDLPEDERTEYHRKFTARFHALLDAGHGTCLFKHPGVSLILMDLLTTGHESTYHLDA